jgi:hypothetical protein
MRKRAVETADYLRMVERMIRAAGRRVGRADAEDLGQLVALRLVLDEAIVKAVVELRDDGITWESIGEATGTTRQAAIMKWAAAARSQSG